MAFCALIRSDKHLGTQANHFMTCQTICLIMWEYVTITTSLVVFSLIKTYHSDVNVPHPISFL